MDVAGNGDALGESKVTDWSKYRYILSWDGTSPENWNDVIKSQIMPYVIAADKNTGATFDSWTWNVQPTVSGSNVGDNYVGFPNGTLTVKNSNGTKTTYNNVTINMAKSIAEYFRYKLGITTNTDSPDPNNSNVKNFLTVVTHALQVNSVPSKDSELAINRNDVIALAVPGYTYTGDYLTNYLIKNAVWSSQHWTTAVGEVRHVPGGVQLIFGDNSTITIGPANLNIISAMPNNGVTFATSQVNQITHGNLPDITTDNAKLGIANAHKTYTQDDFTCNGKKLDTSVSVNFNEFFKPTYTWLSGDIDYDSIIRANTNNNDLTQTAAISAIKSHALTADQIAKMNKDGGQFTLNILVQYHDPDGTTNDGYQIIPVKINVKNLAKVVSVETNDDLIHINTPATDFTDATAKDAIKSLTYKDVNGNTHTVLPTDTEFNNLITGVSWSKIPTNDGTDAEIKVTFKDASINSSVKVNVVQGAAQNGLTVDSGASFTTKYSDAASGISNTDQLSQWVPNYKWVNADGSEPTYDTVWTPDHKSFTAYVQINYHRSATDNTADGSEIVPVTVNINQATAAITQTGSASKNYDGQPISVPSVATLTNSANWSTSGLIGSDKLDTSTLTADDFDWYLGNQDLGKLSNTGIAQIKNGTVGTYTIKLNSAGIAALKTANPNYKVTYSGVYTYTVSQASANANSITGSYTITYGDTPDFSKATDPYTVHLTTNPLTITGFTPSYPLTKGTQLQFRKHGTNENWSSTVPTDAGTYDVMISDDGWTDLKNAKGNSNITVNATGSTTLTTTATFTIKSKVTFEFVDDDNDGAQVGDSVVKGMPINTSSSVNLSMPKNYDLATGQSGFVLNSDGTLAATYKPTQNENTVTIHLKHATKPVDSTSTDIPSTVQNELKKDVTRTINYEGLSASQKDQIPGSEKGTQTVHFSGAGTYDLVDHELVGNITWTASPESYAGFTPKTFAGYTATIKIDGQAATSIGDFKPSANSANQTVTISYAPISQPATPDKPAQGSDQGTKPGSTPASTPGEKPGTKPGTNPIQPTKPEVPGNKPHKPVKPNKPSKPTNGGSQNFKPSHNDQNFKPNSDDFPKGTHWENGKLVGPNGEIFYENGRLTRVGRACLPQTGEKQNNLAAIFGALASGIGLLSLIGERKRKDKD